MPQQEGGSPAILLKEISWELYESLLAQLERSGQHLYLTYDRGTLEIMPPSPFHERYKKVIGRFIETMTMEMGIPICALGSTTFKREDRGRGLEPDECYYVQHEPEMGKKDKIDLTIDPPADLVIEMDHTHHAIDREDVYAALGVPEIWQYDGEHVPGFQRGADGAYARIETSIAFPFLKLADVDRFAALAKSTSQDHAVREFRQWLLQTHLRKT
jgi:Uma2 family endonuclease